MAQLNDTMVQGDLRVTGKIYGTDNAIRLENANLAIPPLGNGEYVGSTGDFFIGSGSGKNLPDTSNNFNIHTTVTHFSGTIYRLTQIATPTSSSNPVGIYERSGSSSDGVTWTFGSWLAAANSSHTHGNIANGGTLTDTAAAAAGNDYVVIRDADNAKIQTSTIKGTDVADAVSKKHSHSTLTLSTTAQAYDGSHTLALPSTDPYTSARTPASHTHGNIQNNGSIVGGSDGTGKSIADGDRLIVAEATNAGKYNTVLTTAQFDGTTTSKALTQKGTFETFQGDVKYQLVEYGALQYSNITTILNAGKVPVVYSDNSLYVCDGTAYTVNGVNEYRFTKTSGNVDSPRIIYMRIRDDSSGWGGGVVGLASTSELSTKADASVVSTLSSNVSSHTTLFHSEVLNVTDQHTRFLKITFSGRVGRCIAIILMSSGTDSTANSIAFRLSWEYINSTNGIKNIGRDIFSWSNLDYPPLVYKDSSSFYIGPYSDLNRSATISVMMTSEDPSKVSYSTVTRAVATASDKTNVPITWHAVSSETVNEIHAAIYDDTSGTTVATTINELKSWYSTRPNIILVERHKPSGSVSTTQKVYMLTDTSYSQGNPTKFVFTRVRNDTNYMGDVETMTCTSSGWTYSISNTKNATYAVSAGSADSATTADSSTYATSAGTASVANGYSTGGAIDQALQGLESRKLTTSSVYSDASGTASFLAIAAVPVVIDIASSQSVDIEALIRGMVSSAYRYDATSPKPYSRLWVLVNTSSYSKTFSGFADGSSLKIGAYRTACVAQIGPNFYKPVA